MIYNFLHLSATASLWKSEGTDMGCRVSPVKYARGFVLFCFDCSNNAELEMQQCVVSIVASDALVLKHQGISIHCVGYIFIVLDKFH